MASAMGGMAIKNESKKFFVLDNMISLFSGVLRESMPLVIPAYKIMSCERSRPKSKVFTVNS